MFIIWTGSMELLFRYLSANLQQFSSNCWFECCLLWIDKRIMIITCKDFISESLPSLNSSMQNENSHRNRLVGLSSNLMKQLFYILLTITHQKAPTHGVKVYLMMKRYQYSHEWTQQSQLRLSVKERGLIHHSKLLNLMTKFHQPQDWIGQNQKQMHSNCHPLSEIVRQGQQLLSMVLRQVKMLQNLNCLNNQLEQHSNQYSNS